jgi:hypothetical protein
MATRAVGAGERRGPTQGARHRVRENKRGRDEWVRYCASHPQSRPNGSAGRGRADGLSTITRVIARERSVACLEHYGILSGECRQCFVSAVRACAVVAGGACWM